MQSTSRSATVSRTNIRKKDQREPVTFGTRPISFQSISLNPIWIVRSGSEFEASLAMPISKLVVSRKQSV